MRWDKFQYILDSSSTERYQLLSTGIEIHLKGSKTHHIAKCNRNIRTFLTRDINQVTCNKCKEIK